MSLIGGSRVILLDEPTVGVDQGSRDVIIKLLKEYSRDKYVCMVCLILCLNAKEISISDFSSRLL